MTGAALCVLVTDDAVEVAFSLVEVAFSLVALAVAVRVVAVVCDSPAVVAATACEAVTVVEPDGELPEEPQPAKAAAASSGAVIAMTGLRRNEAPSDFDCPRRPGSCPPAALSTLTLQIIPAIRASTLMGW